MIDTNVSTSQETLGVAARWLLLIAQLPPKPDYLRVKLRRRVQRIGAVALRSSVFALPNRPDTTEDLIWLRTELLADGADAIICGATPIAGLTDAELERRFQAGRDGDYDEIVEEARAVTAAGGREEAVRALPRLRRRLGEVAKLDFFGAERGEVARVAIAELSGLAAVRIGASQSDAPRPAPRAASRGRTWVTREGVFVDRIASAWLIRRFIDPDATFKFVGGRSYRPQPDELRFDMYQAEYTHEGDRCTFETLLDRFDLEDDPALGAIAEIVHDIDLKDEKFGREEAAGVAIVLGGISRTHARDADRLRQGAAVFDGLYAQLGGARA